MANPQQAERGLELDDGERRVLKALTDARGPVEAVALASAVMLSVEETFEILRRLLAKGVIEQRPAEPIRDRFEVDDEALQRVAG